MTCQKPFNRTLNPWGKSGKRAEKIPFVPGLLDEIQSESAITDEDEEDIKEFEIFQHPNGNIQAVKRGWSWPAFFSTIIWLLTKRMWLWVGVFCLSMLLFIISHYLNNTIFSMYYLIMLLLGLYGNSLWGKNLLKRGYKFKEDVFAVNQVNAILKYQGKKPHTKNR